jgi:transcriptional regulator with XRE-family HTH domain
MENTVNIGSKIKKIRQSANISQDELAEMVGITSRFVKMIENDEKKPSVPTLYAIADACKRDIIFSKKKSRK